MKNNRSYQARRELRQQRGEGSCSFTKRPLRAAEITQSRDLEIKLEIGNWTSSWQAARTPLPLSLVPQRASGRQGLGLLHPHVQEGRVEATGPCSVPGSSGGTPLAGLTQFLMREPSLLQGGGRGSVRCRLGRKHCLRSVRGMLVLLSLGNHLGIKITVPGSWPGTQAECIGRRKTAGSRGGLVQVPGKGQAELGTHAIQGWRTEQPPEEKEASHGRPGQPQVPDSPSPSGSLGRKPASEGCRL